MHIQKKSKQRQQLKIQQKEEARHTLSTHSSTIEFHTFASFETLACVGTNGILFGGAHLFLAGRHLKFGTNNITFPRYSSSILSG